MSRHIATLTLYGDFAFPGVARTVKVHKSFLKNGERIKQSFEQNQPVFLLSYELENGVTEKFAEIGTIARLLNFEETENEYIMSLLGVNRAQVDDFDNKYKEVISWTRLDYKRDFKDRLHVRYEKLIQGLKQYALFMNSLSAHNAYEKFSKINIRETGNTHLIEQTVNRIAMTILDETDAHPAEYVDYLTFNRLSDLMSHLERRLYAFMIKEYNERYHFAEYQTEIPEIDLAVEAVGPEEREKEEEKVEQAKSSLHDVFNQEDDELEGQFVRMIEKSMPDKNLKIMRREVDMLKRESEESKTRIDGLRYLQHVANLPWYHERKQIDLMEAKHILDSSHYGMDEAKNEIIKFLAERALNEEAKGSVLCLAGPPGVGKTSLVKTVAKAMNREFIQIKLGGVSDESILRGFPRTYSSAEPGILMKEFEKLDYVNPVILLDEIDKINVNARQGDISAALLEVLDPSQNSEYRDHYLNLPYDLSKVLFIATANYVDNIPPALKDRMEVVELNGYTKEEKLTIVQKYILAPILRDGWLNKYDVHIEKAAIEQLIDAFANEPGVRSLERTVLSICREIAVRIMIKDEKSFHITADNIVQYTGHINENNEEPIYATGEELEEVKRRIGFLRDEE